MMSETWNHLPPKHGLSGRISQTLPKTTKPVSRQFRFLSSQNCSKYQLRHIDAASPFKPAFSPKLLQDKALRVRVL